jgi:hypothetical protein
MLYILVEGMTPDSRLNIIKLQGWDKSLRQLSDLCHFFSFLIHTQSVGLLGRGISPSQDPYLHTE